jgi:NAD(P)-dependent dehydrogenase (short-subunit alcohol dehydrogenase family)
MRAQMLPDGTLEGKVALVTGGGTGLGLAMAVRFATLGARLVLASRKPENLEQGEAAVKAAGAEVLALPTDVRDAGQVERAVEAAVERFGRIDVLVNNAAGIFRVAAEDLSVNGWNAVVNTILHGTFYASLAAGRRMIAQGEGGAILNILTTKAWRSGPGTIHATSAKAGVLAMTRTLAVEWGHNGIRVNAIAPGPFATEGAALRLWGSPEAAERVRQGIPVGRFGRPEEIADLAAFLVSPYAGFINGEVVVADGGEWLNQARPEAPAAQGRGTR